MKEGVVFDVEEFTVFDGPGLRQTVFLKGCPLRCSWCHNPEGLSPRPQLMVSKGSCLHCGACARACREQECISCGACIPVCPLHLRRMAGEEMTSEELANRIRKNSGYYEKYGGGVTFSGGEPLFQGEFLTEVLEQLPGVHKAIETSGYCGEPLFRQVIGYLDYVMMDIKLFDGELHRKYTGVDNRQILRNARILCEGNIPFVIRIPLIPGVNDYEENFRNTAAWIADARALLKVELLPYHKTAGAKYDMVGKTYQPAFDTEKSVWHSQQVFEEYGIRSEVL